MHDGIDAFAAERFRQRGRVRDVADLQNGSLVEVRKVAGREVVHHQHGVSPREQGVDDVTAKEPGAASDQDAQ